MIALAVAAMVVWRRRTGARWSFFGAGALAWTVGVALKFAWAIPLNAPILALLSKHLGRASGVASWLYVGLLTGIFEVGATWAFARLERMRKASADEAMAFGIGFGAFEALLLGVASFVVLAGALLFWSKLPDAAQRALGGHSTPWMIAIPVVERAYTIVAHAISCVLVFQGVQQRRASPIVASFVYKTLIDGLAAWGIMAWGVRTNTTHLAWFEVVMAVLIALTVPVVWLFRPRPSEHRLGAAA
jgi:uncharacterized membrane protein YhfC